MGQFYLRLSILYLSLSSEIRASIEFNKEGSELHIRKKRLIDNSVGGNQPVPIEEVPYIVNIYQNNTRFCGGAILSSIVIITAAHCVDEEATYTILSGSAHKSSGIQHCVKAILIHPHFYNNNFWNDLALVVIDSPIDLVNSPNRKIELYEGPIPPHSLAQISGWGCFQIIESRRTFPCLLRSITVPIITPKVCRLYYKPNEISSKNVCTFDREGYKSTAPGDSGNPLVLNQRLLGIMSFSNGTLTHPDVFIRVSHFDHEFWIISSIQWLHARFLNHTV